MGIVFMIVAGAALGWLAAVASRAQELSRSVHMPIASGVAGALLAGLVVSPLLGTGSMAGGPYDVSALLVSVLGALVAISAVVLLQVRKSG
ncbi:GlsB/YeaQ/YmgE family stress response membrane protein [Aurantiacibacter sp. D1-12]|uniref:GlsB/YeaQ/YmgE family stress response membrane protein n=1 Tax=Aurantiacibacter sp. D1-12 TaxID=2993658 RepID=UPI00237CE9DB|nr:GlsB/YeaQ/YmgE family stress response membrane protein [Aurantiacibacter sp. D1-12]MDE1467421.1 GlsB/YeaQ/YmgE family stress response membrane protein [Aurantiacibacter sp. D1-12]